MPKDDEEEQKNQGQDSVDILQEMFHAQLPFAAVVPLWVFASIIISKPVKEAWQDSLPGAALKIFSPKKKEFEGAMWYKQRWRNLPKKINAYHATFTANLRLNRWKTSRKQ